MKILILPGLDGTAELLADIVGLLASNYDVTVVRYLPKLLRYQDLKAVVEAFLPADEYIIVAESFSGPIAAMIASENPRGLRGVVFVATFAKTPFRVPAVLTYIVDIAPLKSRLLARLAQPFLMGKWANREFTERFQEVLNVVPASTIGGRLREILKVDVTNQIRHIQVPTIYLAAGHDRLVPSRMASHFNRAPNRVVEIEGPHFLLQANAAEAAKHILDFASRCN